MNTCDRCGHLRDGEVETHRVDCSRLRPAKDPATERVEAMLALMTANAVTELQHGDIRIVRPSPPPLPGVFPQVTKAKG